MDEPQQQRYRRIADGLRERRRMSRLGRLLERLHLRRRVLAPQDEWAMRAPAIIAIGLYPDSLQRQLELLGEIGSVRDQVQLLAEHAQLASHAIAGGGTHWLDVSMPAVDHAWRGILDLARHMPPTTPEGVWQYIYGNLEGFAQFVLDQAAAEGRTPAKEYGRGDGVADEPVDTLT